MRKIFTFLFAALMSVSMFATTYVTITNSDFPGMDVFFTKDGVTVSADWIDNMNSGNLVGPGSFSTTLGNFTKIEVNAGEVLQLGEGWSGNSERQTWTGNASSVSFSGEIYGVGHGITIMCTIEESAPQPAEVTVVFAANNKTVEKTVALPHTFEALYSNKNGELDLIIRELYGIANGECLFEEPTASGNAAVTAGGYEKTDDYTSYFQYITISEAFEGTATVTGNYWNWDLYDGDGDVQPYSLTISIKSDEPTAIDNTAVSEKATKRIVNGQLLIEKNGKIYNVMGAEVK